MSDADDDKTTITVRIPKNLKKSVEDFCQSADVSLSMFVKIASRALLQDPERKVALCALFQDPEKFLPSPRPETEVMRNHVRGAAYLAECALAYARSFDEPPAVANPAYEKLLAAAVAYTDKVIQD